MEDDGLERRDPRFEPDLAVVVPEELRIGQPGTQHALIAGDDGGTMIAGFHVGDQEEPRRQFSVAILERKIFLVRAHRGGQHLRRQIHIGRIDAAHQHDRPFDKADNLVHQPVVAPDCKGFSARQALSVFANDMAPFDRVDNDLAHPEPCLVRGKIRYRETLRAEEAMAESLLARGDRPRMLGRAQRHLEIHQLAVEHRHDVVQRAHPGGAVIAPAHGFRPGNAEDRLGQNSRQHGAGGPAGHAFDIEPGRVLVLAALLAGIEAGNAAGLEKGLDHIVRSADPRPLDLVHPVGLVGGQAIDPERQAARRGKTLGSCEGKAQFGQLFGNQAFQILGRPRLHAGWDFLG